MISNKSINQPIILPGNISLTIKRDDLLHPTIPGNKFRKLKYNIASATNGGYKKLLTFGGAYSNHIAAVAACGIEFGFETIGIIRGDELLAVSEANPTLHTAKNNGMSLKFISREDYKNKDKIEFIKFLEEEFGPFYLIPEGGTNELAVRGCEEILSEEDLEFDYICNAVGTGGTIAGIIRSCSESQKVLGFPALKGDFLNGEISRFTDRQNWQLISDYHFGGYGKVTSELINFMNDFFHQTKIVLDPVYTGKMIFGVMDMIRAGYFSPGTNILAIHTGGLQGIAGMNRYLKNKQLPLILTND